MTPMSDSQTEARVAAIFAGNHTPPRDMDKSATEDENAQPNEEIENEVEENTDQLAVPDDADLGEDERREETADRLRQADYTRKTMQLAAERKAW